MVKPQTLSVCMVVKNGEKTLDIALSSLQSIYDDLVIMDTGSNDSTMDIAARYNARIIPSDWFDHSAKQRNSYLKEVQTDWLFVLDQDEFIDKKTVEFLEYIKSNPSKIHHDNFWLTRKWISNYSKNLYLSSPPHYPDWQHRLFKYNPNFCYSGRLHVKAEGLTTQGLAISELCIYHLDLLVKSESERKRKVQIYESAEKNGGMPHYYVPVLENVLMQKWNHSEMSETTRTLFKNLPLKCKICESDSHFFSQARLLQKYDVEYYHCSNCGFVQTEDPYWLEEAYQKAIADSDVGLVYRNNMMANLTSILLFNYFDHEAQFLDYGAGYGLFVRLMRDRGFDFYWQDKFCANIFAKGFEYEDYPQSEFLLVTAFELFEHFVYPHQEIEKLLQLAPNILFSTQLLLPDNPSPNDWWYYALHEGQHISIYTLASLECIAEKYGRKLYSDGSSVHLFSNDENLPTNLFDLIKDRKLSFPDKESLISHDFNQVVSLSLGINGKKTYNDDDNAGTYYHGSPFILIDGVFFQLYKTGIARVWKSLLEQWANSEFVHHILVLDRGNTAPKIPGIRYRTIPPYDYNNTEADKQMLQQICDEEGAELFISSYYTTPIDTPSVFMAYDMIPEVMGANLEDPMWREKHHAITHATSYIAISENTAKDLQRFFPNIGAGQITVAHCGVSQNFSPASQQAIEQFKYKYGIHKHYFLLGGLGGYKNGILFLQAFNQLTNQQSFDIVVTGPNHQLPAEWRQLTVGCTFHSLQLSDEELRLAYAGAIALIYPSLYEGFGMPVIEAMACGCPVITTPNASLPEVAGDAAIYVNDQDVDAMADALCEIQKPSVRKQLIERGKQQASQFSWETMADSVQNALLGAVNPVPLGEINFIIFPDWQRPEEILVTELGTVIKTLNSQLTDSVTLLIDASGIGPEDAELFVTGLLLSLTLEESLTLNENLDIQCLGEMSSPQWAKILPATLARFQLDCDDLEAVAQAQAEDLPTLHCSAPNYLLCPDWRRELELVAQELASKLITIATDPTITPGSLSIDAPAEMLDQATETLLDIVASLTLEQGLDLSENWTISLVSDLTAQQWSALLVFIEARLSLPHEDDKVITLPEFDVLAKI